MTDPIPAPAMRHITKVRLENFQSHADTTIHLEEGINLITGSSDAGKSAILRGINWVMHNRPNGKGFIKSGTTESRVTLWFSDGTIVQRIKGDNRNAVLVKKCDGSDTAYDRFGNDYPDEVVEALGFPPTDDKHGPISYAEQMAPYFLVSLTPTELPRILAELTRLDDIQDAADNLAKRAREKDRQAKQGLERIARFEQELEVYSGLDADIDKQEILDKRAARVEKVVHRLKFARDIVSRHKEIMQQARGEVRARDLAAQTLSHAPQVDLARKLCDKVANLRQFSVQVLQIDTEIAAATMALDVSKKLASSEFANRCAALIQQVDSIRNMRDLLSSYKDVMKQGALAIQDKETANASLKVLEEEKDSLRAQIVTAGLWCSACERPLDEPLMRTHAHAG